MCICHPDHFDHKGNFNKKTGNYAVHLLGPVVSKPLRAAKTR